MPVENTGGPGTREGHWRETVFRNELMSGFIAAPGNPMSRVTVASLGDLGYEVDIDAAEPYRLPAPRPPAGDSAAITGPARLVLPVIPRVLPASSLIEGG